MEISKLSQAQIANNQKYIGQKFNRFTVLELVGNVAGSFKVVVKAKCDCETIKITHLASLKRGLTKSCGCYILEFPSRKTHGKVRTPLYNVWKSMRQRCSKQNDVNYWRYGGAGVLVCDEWEDYVKFENWAEANGYAKGLHLDRIDGNGNYAPSNCRFVTREVNMNNRKDSVKVLLDGVFMSATQASLKLGNARGHVGEIGRGEIKNPFPDRLQFLGDYETWSKLYPEHR